MINDEVKAERLSVAAEQRYRALVNDSADALVVADGTGRITFASPAVSTILGWDPADLVGMVVMDDLVHPDDRAGAVAAREALLADGVGRYRARLRHPDTRYSWVEANIRVTRGPDGGLVGTTATWRDIDAEVSAKQRAGEQEARRQAVLDSMLDPHALLTALRDASGTIVDFVYADANDAACVYNQLPREQLVGTSLLELLPGHAGTGLFAQYCHTVQTGEPLVLDDYVYPHEILAEPRHFDIRGVKVGDALSFTWRDVTERTVAMERLAASEARYRMLVDRVAHVTVVADSQAVVQFISDGVIDLLGYDPNELIGTAIPELVHVEDQQDESPRV